MQGRSVVYAPLGLGFMVRVSDRVRVRSIISVSFRVRVMVSADIW